MRKFCLENYFVTKLGSVGGFPHEEATELAFLSTNDPNWIIILFSNYLNPFRVEKIGGTSL